MSIIWLCCPLVTDQIWFGNKIINKEKHTSVALYFLVRFYLLGRGRGKGTGRRFPVSWDKGGGHSNCGLFPFPWLGVDLIKRETHDLLALFRGRDTGEVN